MSSECLNVGDANPDIAGIGIILLFVIQVGLAIVASMYKFYLDLRLRRIRKADLSNATAQAAMVKLEKRSKVVNEISLQAGDIQALTGISLLLSGIIQINSLPFYHLRIVYEPLTLCTSIESSYNA
ncbi:hypothetical protein L207DRAFT_522514 [Hyaloscypha variabilis F]|uniref:Uncharacterized protein n=1 Tax=Hyaloscypha variabilis (strain UAMH 11265 / GT02V1 / F) TaxID=1149755 RepID=A0A2J6S8H8_HYAVF|nr:hypothetical protein L207DRAFT_522514 [Hyaloscypha variabilis F]